MTDQANPTHLNRRDSSPLSFPPRLPEEISKLLTQPFSYGFESELKMGKALIVELFEPQAKYTMFTRLPHISDSVWIGHCGTDVALSYAVATKVLPRDQIKIEHLAFDFPNLGLKRMVHKRIVIPDLDNLIIDHTKFFRSLNPAHAKIEEFKVPSNLALGPETKFDIEKPFFLKDFELGKATYLFSARIIREPNPAPLQLRIDAKEQIGGTLIRGFRVTLDLSELEQMGNGRVPPLTAEEWLQMYRLEKINYFENGKMGVCGWPSAELRQQFAESFSALLKGLNLGGDPDVVGKFLDGTIEGMRKAPLGWWHE